MKIRFTLDRGASPSKKSEVVTKVNRELGAKATIAGDVITVDQWDEQKVVAILNNLHVNYSRAE